MRDFLAFVGAALVVLGICAVAVLTDVTGVSLYLGIALLIGVPVWAYWDTFVRGH
jgi:hypothetical protein